MQVQTKLHHMAKRFNQQPNIKDKIQINQLTSKYHQPNHRPKMKFRDKIKNKVKAVSKIQQTTSPKSRQQLSVFDESHFNINFTNAHQHTQTSCIKVTANWAEGYGINSKGDEAILKLACKWYRRTQTNIEEIKNYSDTYQMSLDDVETTIQVQCVPEAQEIDYQGMPINQMIGPIILDPETRYQTDKLINTQKAAFWVHFKQLNLQNIQEDESVITQGRITIIDNKLLEIYASLKGEKGLQLIHKEEMFANESSYPEVLNVAENPKMISLLINETNDFVSIELQNHTVRDIFCLLIKRLKELNMAKRESVLLKILHANSSDVFADKEDAIETIEKQIWKKEQYNQLEHFEPQGYKDEQAEQIKLTSLEDESKKCEKRQKRGEQGEENKYKLPSFLSSQSSTFSSPIKFVPQNLELKQFQQDQTLYPTSNLEHVYQFQHSKQSQKLQQDTQMPTDMLQQQSLNTLQQQRLNTLKQQNLNRLEQQSSNKLEQKSSSQVRQHKEGQQQRQGPLPQPQCSVEEQQNPNSHLVQIQQVEYAQPIQIDYPDSPGQEAFNNDILNENCDSIDSLRLTLHQNCASIDDIQRQNLHHQEQPIIQSQTVNLNQQLTNQMLHNLQLQIQQQQRTKLQLQFSQQFSLKLQSLENQLRSQYHAKLIHQVQTKQKILRTQLQLEIQTQIEPRIKSQTQKFLRPIIKSQLLPVLKSQCINYFTPIIREQSLNELTPKIREQLMPKIREELTPQIRNQLKPKIKEQLIPEIRDQLTSQIRDQLKPKIREQLMAEIREELKPKIREQITPKIKQGLMPLVREELRLRLKQELTPVIKQQLLPVIRAQLTPKIRDQVTPEIKKQITPQIQQQVQKQLKPRLTQQMYRQKQAKLCPQSLIFEQIVTATPPLNKIQPQELVYYKNELKLLQKDNSQLKTANKALIHTIAELQEEIKRYRPNNSTNDKPNKVVNDPNLAKQPAKHSNQKLQYSVPEMSKQVHSQSDLKPSTSLSQVNPISESHFEHTSIDHKNPKPPSKHQEILTPYEKLQQQLQKTLQQNKHLLTKQEIMASEKESIEEELMKFKVELEELEAQKKHLQKKYESLFNEIQNNSTTLNTQSNLNTLFMSSQNMSSIANMAQNNPSHCSSATSSPVKSMKSITSPGLKPLDQPESPIEKHTSNAANLKNSFSTNRKSFADSRFVSPSYPSPEYPTTQYEKMSQAIMNHYSSEQELVQARKQLVELTEENASLRAILQKEKKTSLPLIGSSTSSKQLKLQMMELKKLANRLTEELTEKNQVIQNMKSINRELNNKLCEVTKEFHLTKMNLINRSS